MTARQDKRAARTEAALIDAHNHLFLSKRGPRIRVAEIVAQAQVGRSTFYDHFAGADDIQMAALAPPFAILAEAAAGSGEEAKLTMLLRHFWENRRRARQTLEGRTGEKAGRLLAGQVEELLRPREADLALPLRLAARQLAEAALSPLRGWIVAEAPASPGQLAAAICRGGRALRAALAATPDLAAP